MRPYSVRENRSPSIAMLMSVLLGTSSSGLVSCSCPLLVVYLRESVAPEAAKVLYGVFLFESDDFYGCVARCYLGMLTTDGFLFRL